MLDYLQKNVNPKNRKTGDCSTRALAELLNITWDEALTLQYQEAIKTKYDMTSRQVIERILARYGFTKKPQPRKSDRTKYQVCQMDRVLSTNEIEEGVMVNVAHHYVVIKDWNYIDTWDSGYKTVGNYYSKEVY